MVAQFLSRSKPSCHCPRADSQFIMILAIAFVQMIAAANGAVIVQYWTNWSSWGPCTVTCSTGSQYRTRSCVGGMPGQGGCPNRWWQARACMDRYSCFTVPTTVQTSATSTSTTTSPSTTSTAATTSAVSTTTTTTEAKSSATPLLDRNGCLDPKDRGSYRGMNSRTISGFTCQRWDSQNPHPHNYTPQRHAKAGLAGNNYCRNPDMDEKPWCFTTNPNKQWEYCEVPVCLESEKKQFAEGRCYDSSDKQSYTGSVSVTETGMICQNWNSTTPHKHLFPTEKFASAHLGDHNFCRNPDNDTRPWCFTTDPSINWAYCSVPMCSDIGDTRVHISVSDNAGECGKPSIKMAPHDSVRVPFVPMFGSFNQPRIGLFGGVMSEGGMEGDVREDLESITGGFEATPGSIPWQASIRRTYSGSHFCGGSLISRYWIITAAHCITQPRNPSSYFAILGDHNQYEMDSNQKRVDFRAIFRHHEYNSNTLENDITLMKMTRPVELDERILSVCLPPPHSMPEYGEMAIVSGWGTMQVTGSNEYLHQASVPILANEDCRRLMGAADEALVCAGFRNGGKDSCQGDSGGPLVRKTGEDLYELLGIVSWGYGCAEENKPVVYTKVSHYVDWIEDIIS